MSPCTFSFVSAMLSSLSALAMSAFTSPLTAGATACFQPGSQDMQPIVRNRTVTNDRLK